MRSSPKCAKDCSQSVFRSGTWRSSCAPCIRRSWAAASSGDRVLTFGEASYGIFDTAAFRGSPVAVVYRDGRPLRFRLDSPEARAFPQLDELRAEGGTEYVAVPIKFSNGEVHVGTWATRHPGGFTDAHRAALETLIAPLARVTENYALRRTATNLL